MTKYLQWLILPLTVLSIAVVFLILPQPSDAQTLTKNGFSLIQAKIPTDEILSGGPPKDGIPAINFPKFLSADGADFLNSKDRVLGIVINGTAKAYPIRILNWHEIVNDKIDSEAFAITFCPLCGTGIAFSRKIAGKTTSFGVSGLLYNSDVLLYDRETESLWSQILQTSVTGELSGKKLTALPIQHTTWQSWKKQYPDTLVLSRNTGYNRDYDRDPYQGYEESRRLFFDISNPAPNHLHPKERVIGIEINGQHKAYPYSELSKHGKSRFTETFAEKSLTVNWDENAQAATITNASGELLSTTIGFWFAWYTFFPKTSVFGANL